MRAGDAPVRRRLACAAVVAACADHGVAGSRTPPAGPARRSRSVTALDSVGPRSGERLQELVQFACHPPRSGLTVLLQSLLLGSIGRSVLLRVAPVGPRGDASAASAPVPCSPPLHNGLAYRPSRRPRAPLSLRGDRRHGAQMVLRGERPPRARLGHSGRDYRFRQETTGSSSQSPCHAALDLISGKVPPGPGHDCQGAGASTQVEKRGGEAKTGRT